MKVKLGDKVDLDVEGQLKDNIYVFLFHGMTDRLWSEIRAGLFVGLRASHRISLMFTLGGSLRMYHDES